MVVNKKKIVLAVFLLLALPGLCFAKTVSVTKVAQLGGEDYRSVVVRGNYAYCTADQNGFIIIDISDPADPFIRGRCSTSANGNRGNARAVVLSGNYAYVADRYSDLVVIDISRASSPKVVGSLEFTRGWGEDIDIYGQYAVVAADYGGVHIIDISDPPNPAHVSTFTTLNDTEGVVVSGHYAYVPIGGSGLQVVNISNPAGPYETAYRHTGNDAEDAAVSGNYLYIADGYAGLRVMNISNPASPVLAGSRDTPVDSQGVAVSGNYAYVADGYGGLQIMDISTPSAPEPVGAYDDDDIYAKEIAVAGGYIYVTDQICNRFYIFSISAAGTPDSITVTAPNGGEKWKVGTTHTITWTQNGLTGDVTIDLLRDGVFHSNIGTAAASALSYSWSIPPGLTPGDGCRVQIYRGSVTDTSDNTFSITAPSSPSPTIALDRETLNFGAAGGTGTPGQTVIIGNSGVGTLNWTAAADASWLGVGPSSGTGPAAVTVTVNPSSLAAGTYTGSVSFSDPNAGNSPQTVNVTLDVYNAGASSQPFGDFETPTNCSGLKGSITVTGWALDDIGVETVQIYREQGGGLIYIGDAVFVEGARPDIEAAYPGYPMNYRAGWGYMMLSNFLPQGGNGSYVIHAAAVDTEGKTVTLGTKTISCNNADAVKPFGAIDTPAQGGTASGTGYINWGWVLTPQPNRIPTDGSTINVFVDGVNLGHPTYNLYRADIAGLFPNYANKDGAAGYFTLDTTAYADGVHTIYWTAADNAGNTDGIGSRYFSIRNTQGARSIEHGTAGRRGKTPAPCSELAWSAVDVIKGYDRGAIPSRIFPDENGIVTVEIKELERVVVHFHDSIEIMGYLEINGQLRSLPIGSTLDAERGAFYWTPGPGFIGEYPFLFVERDRYGDYKRRYITVTIGPGF